ncbi:hypothetical protein VSF3289_00124 [Vibrio scophthalmi]|uniref:Uncharacterized protein n=1 Tax=Vibrio scophthalmi TaxID=45658 RepID=A0A1E3WJD5_9VIBR|nr:hypothetical protein VSF3289_00124 [Vibrio scophthalmi]
MKQCANGALRAPFLYLVFVACFGSPSDGISPWLGRYVATGTDLYKLDGRETGLTYCLLIY